MGASDRLGGHGIFGGSGSVRVWHATTASASETLAALLNAGELTRRSRFHHVEDRDRFLTAWALARAVLADALGCRPGDLTFDRTCLLCGGPHGKPRVSGPTPDLIDFSLSHSGVDVLVALAEVRGGKAGIQIGVDVEEIRPGAGGRGMADLLPLALSERERAEFERRGLGYADFLAWWTRKEAIVKSSGHGLALPLAGVELTAPGAPCQVLGLPEALGAPADFTVRDLIIGPGSRAAIAVRGADEGLPDDLAPRDGSGLLRSLAAA